MRRALLALALLAARPGSAVAQWRSRPMVLPAPAGAQVLLGRFSSPTSPGDEIMVVDPATGAVELRSSPALLAPTAWPYTLPVNTPIRAARTSASNADLLADIAYPQGGNVVVRYSSAYWLPVPRIGGPAGLISFAHAMPHDGDTLVCPNSTAESGLGWIEIWDFETTSLGGTALVRSWRADGLAPLEATPLEIFGVRLSPAAIALGIDDLALPTSGGVLLYVNAPPTPDLLYPAPLVDTYSLELATIMVGGPSALARPAWLPPTVERTGDALGAAALDVDLDGRPDLVFTYGSTLDHPDGRGGFFPGHLIAVRSTGDPRDLATGPWEDLTGHPDLQLVDPVILRQVQVGGAPAAALWDRDLDEIVVIWADPAVGRLRTWRGDAAGRKVRDIRIADVVGSPAPDLVVVAEDLLVYPDLGDASPALTWLPGSPGAAIRGLDHLFSAAASDADGPITVEWMVGDPYGPPVASASISSAAGQEVDYLRPAALLCAPPPQSLAVTVRATDALGVFDELSATLDVAFPQPALTLAGSLPAGDLALPPGGTSATFDGSSLGGCSALAFTWGGRLFDAVTSFVEEGPLIGGGQTTTRRIVALPESSYAALLAVADPDVTLTASDGAVASPLATLPVTLDASGLVEVRHAADRAALASGEVAVLETIVRSRLGVALPGVGVRHLLAGLEPAGEPTVRGAAVAEVLGGGAEVVIDTLPPAGSEVVVELPVRATGDRAASAAEAVSSGGHRLSPSASVGAGGAPLPGCGCGSGGPSGALGVLALALWRGRRARRAT